MWSLFEKHKKKKNLPSDEMDEKNEKPTLDNLKMWKIWEKRDELMVMHDFHYDDHLNRIKTWDVLVKSYKNYPKFD